MIVNATLGGKLGSLPGVPSRSPKRYVARVAHQWWGVWPMDLRRLLHLVPRNVEFSVVGSRSLLAGRRALCGKRLIAVAGEFVRLKDVEPHRQCSRCLRALKLPAKRKGKRLPL